VFQKIKEKIKRMSDVASDNAWLDELSNEDYEGVDYERVVNEPEVTVSLSSDGKLVVVITSIFTPLIVFGMVVW
jgi:hypothetical protein